MGRNSASAESGEATNNCPPFSAWKNTPIARNIVITSNGLFEEKAVSCVLVTWLFAGGGLAKSERYSGFLSQKYGDPLRSTPARTILRNPKRIPNTVMRTTLAPESRTTEGYRGTV